jgi:hypothetical protein
MATDDSRDWFMPATFDDVGPGYWMAHFEKEGVILATYEQEALS